MTDDLQSSEAPDADSPLNPGDEADATLDSPASETNEASPNAAQIEQPPLDHQILLSQPPLTVPQPEEQPAPVTFQLAGANSSIDPSSAKPPEPVAGSETSPSPKDPQSTKSQNPAPSAEWLPPQSGNSVPSTPIAEVPRTRPESTDSRASSHQEPRQSTPGPKAPAIAPAIADGIATAHRQAIAALDQIRSSASRQTSGEDSRAILRMLAIVEEIHRAAASPPAGASVSADVLSRIERLETWVASNRLP